MGLMIGARRGLLQTRPGYAVEFNGTTAYINCGSGATLDDLADAALTAELWIRLDPDTGLRSVLDKGGFSAQGWTIFINGTTLSFSVQCATADAVASIVGVEFDGKWHHVAVFFDDGGARRAYVALDGVWTAGSVANGAIVADAANSLIVGRSSTTALYFYDGAIGWAALWSDDHYAAGTNFTPPRIPPSPGGNLVECWPLNEGTGVTTKAAVTSPANDGTITDGTWIRMWSG